MSVRFIPASIISAYDAITSLNSNFATIASWLDRFVLRDGSEANSMSRDLDLNHFAVKNIGNPVDQSDAVRLVDLQSAMPALSGSSLATLATSIGAAMVGFISSLSGAVARTVQSKLRDINSVKDFGAVMDGVTNDATAVASAAATGIFFVPQGSLTTNSVPTSFGLISHGGYFNGTNPLDAPYPAYGSGVLRLIQKGTTNVLICVAHNNAAANTNALPVAGTFYGRNDNGGNSVFAVFGSADQHANTGCVQNELDSFNNGAAPSSIFPVDRSIGTTQQVPTALITAAGGSQNSHTAHAICKEGGAPQAFLNGIHATADALVNYFLILTNSSTLKFWVKPDGTMFAQQLTLVPLTVATLPTVGTVGRRAFVTDATVTTFASVVVGGGTNKLPVYDDGTNWRIG